LLGLQEIKAGHHALAGESAEGEAARRRRQSRQIVLGCELGRHVPPRRTCRANERSEFRVPRIFAHWGRLLTGRIDAEGGGLAGSGAEGAQPSVGAGGRARRHAVGCRVLRRWPTQHAVRALHVSQVVAEPA